MILSKVFFLSAVLVPFVPKARVWSRGASAYEPAPLPPLPVEHDRPCDTDQPVVASPRESVPPAPHLRLVSDCNDASSQPVRQVRDASDVDTYWDRVDGLKVASTRAFARWLREHDVSGDLSLRELMSAYGEYCWTFDLKPLSERCLQNRLKTSGFVTSRPSGKVIDGKLHRPTRYRVKPSVKRAA